MRREIRQLTLTIAEPLLAMSSIVSTVHSTFARTFSKHSRLMFCKTNKRSMRPNALASDQIGSLISSPESMVKGKGRISTVITANLSAKSILLVISLLSGLALASEQSSNSSEAQEVGSSSTSSNTASNTTSSTSEQMADTTREKSLKSEDTPNSSQTPVHALMDILPYHAEYQILDGNDKMGTATRILKKESQGLWQLSQSTTIKKWYYKYFFEETSRFELEHDQLVSQSYHSVTQRSFKDDRLIESKFNWANNQESGQYNNHTWQIPLNQKVFDHLNYQLGLRLLAESNRRKESLRVSYKGERTDYVFINEGKETISTPLGDMQTVVWTQQPEYKHGKSVILWLAPDLGYLPIKMAQYRNGKPEGTILLSSLKWL